MKNDGGSAFPVPHAIDGNWNKTPDPSYVGMTLRDWFAGMALQGYIASWPQDGANMVERTDKVSIMCFKFADAMLAEREKP